MPNRCVHCSKVYDDAAKELLEGCSECGGRFFFYMTEEKLKKIQEKEEDIVDLTSSEKKQIERDVRDIARIEDEEAPIILDFESVRIIKPGKYVLDITNLFTKERPLIYKLEEGKYIIDLAEQLKSLGKVFKM